MSLRWEVGSEFHRMPLPAGRYLPWPAPARWYLLARHGLAALLEMLSSRRRTRLWLPAYFCHDVAAYWRRFANVLYYDDEPRRPHPVWSTLRPAAEDVVLAVNYFGVREPAPWYEWRRQHPCVLVEDHPHDPMAPWARRSRADYAIASLRKTLPVSDGGLLWSPRGLPLPPPPRARGQRGAKLKDAAMDLKAAYLSGDGDQRTKLRFRALQMRGEERLKTAPIAAVIPHSRRFLAKGSPQAWREQRERNVRRLLELLDGWRPAEPLFTRWPRGSVPLGAVLVFRRHAGRDRYRELLRRNNVYCPVHWEAARSSSAAARDLAARILTIPADQRYMPADMDIIASLLLRGADR